MVVAKAVSAFAEQPAANIQMVLQGNTGPCRVFVKVAFE